jgi:ribosomal 50S subunit-recycling heat shock protein
MRRINKYKLYKRISTNLLRTPAKIFQFKTSKWNIVIDRIKNKILLVNPNSKRKYFIRRDIGKLRRLKTKKTDNSKTIKVKYSILRTKYFPDSLKFKEKDLDDKKLDLKISPIENKLTIEKDYSSFPTLFSDKLKEGINTEVLSILKKELIENSDVEKMDLVKKILKKKNTIDYKLDSISIPKKVNNIDKIMALENKTLNSEKKQLLPNLTDLSTDSIDICDTYYQKFVDIVENSLNSLSKDEERICSSLIYKQSKTLKNYLEVLYGAPIKIKRKNSFCTKYTLDAYRYYIFRHFLRIDVLLNLLCRFSSTYHATQFINNKIILVNNNKVKKNYYLKKGDIITVPFSYSLLLSKISIKARAKYMAEGHTFTPFLEFDPISNVIIVLKDYKELDYEDMCWLFDKSISLDHLLYKK